MGRGCVLDPEPMIVFDLSPGADFAPVRCQYDWVTKTEISLSFLSSLLLLFPLGISISWSLQLTVFRQSGLFVLQQCNARGGHVILLASFKQM
jgi:hypothetical protein